MKHDDYRDEKCERLFRFTDCDCAERALALAQADIVALKTNRDDIFYDRLQLQNQWKQALEEIDHLQTLLTAAHADILQVQTENVALRERLDAAIEQMRDYTAVQEARNSWCERAINAEAQLAKMQWPRLSTG